MNERAGGVVRVLVRLARLVDSRYTVTVAVIAAFLLRLPGLTRPLRPDEAGFLLVARAWDPRPGSVYGDYFVDRPPTLIAVVELTDRLGGPLAVRVLGAVAGACAVVLAARIGAAVATPTAARWSAVVVAALTTNPVIDTVAAGGELLALPLIGVAIWLSLLAVGTRSARRAAAYSVVVGLAGMTAVGLKQSLVGGLVFAAVLIVASWWWGPLSGRRLGGLALGLVAGACLPVAVTVGWALAAGVRLEELAYTVYGFRSDAAGVLARSSSDEPLQRIGLLLAIAVATGVVAILGGFVVHFRDTWRGDRPAATATAALLAVELVSLVLGGSYWRDYLFPLVPGIALCVALLMRRHGRPRRRTRAVTVLSVASAAASIVVWMGLEVAGVIGYTEAQTGTAIAAAAQPGDSLTVFGGRADVQYSSGLRSPYPHLWSLPMRTLDPEYADLRDLLEGSAAPTWFVAWVPLSSWEAPGADGLARTLEEHYVRHGYGCDDRPIYLRRGLERGAVEPAC